VEIKNRHDPKKGIIAVGNIPSVPGFLESVRVFVAPHQYAAGIQEKIISSLAHGVPVVTMALSANALDITNGTSSGVLVANNAEQMARLVVEVLQKENFWNQLHQSAYRTAQSKFSRIYIPKAFDGCRVLCVCDIPSSATNHR